MTREFGQRAEYATSTKDSGTVHTAFKPLPENSLIELTLEKMARLNINPTSKTTTRESWLKRKLIRENLLILNDSGSRFHLTMDLLFNLQGGKDTKEKAGETIQTNTRGILIRGDIGKTFSFESSFYENQSTFVKYLSDYSTTSLIVPGQGRWKKFKTNGYDYAMASGYVAYRPNRHFYFQAGHGKHFVGEGYRSLLLSDIAFNYPYFRIISSFGKFQYTNLYAVFMNLNSGAAPTPPELEPLFQKKAASFQYLSYQAFKRLQLGLFQGLIWEAADNRNRQHLDFWYFNPVIGTNAIRYGLNDANNIVLGINARLKITSGISLYGQYLMDDMGESGALSNKTGFQSGIKTFNLFGIKDLGAQLEYNQAQPYSYATRKPAQSYTHYNQSLAHPLGANFRETIGLLNYRIKNFFIELKMNYAVMGVDSSNTHYGNSVFYSDNNATGGINGMNHFLGQGVKTDLIYKEIRISYLINPANNFNIVAGISNRHYSNVLTTQETNFVYLGIRTSFQNIYYDF